MTRPRFAGSRSLATRTLEYRPSRSCSRPTPFGVAESVLGPYPLAPGEHRVQFTDAKWAEHLRPGLAWGTESYDIGEPVLRPALERLAGPIAVADKHGAKRASASDDR